jgi:hypothetical protein
MLLTLLIRNFTYLKENEELTTELQEVNPASGFCAPLASVGKKEIIKIPETDEQN